MGSENALQKKPFLIFGMPWPFFFVFSAVVLAAAYMGKLPAGMIGAYPLMIVIGAVFSLIGDNAPVIRSYLGGGAIVVIFGSALVSSNLAGGGEIDKFFLAPLGTMNAADLKTLGEKAFSVLPLKAITTMKNFQMGEGFLDFYIASLITGSIMGMNRKLLIRAAVRYLPSIIGGLLAAAALCGLVGAISGYGAKAAILYICIPIMGGGMGAGAVPLAGIFGGSLAASADPDLIKAATQKALSMMIPAVALGNALSIVCGGLLRRLGNVKPSLTGGTGMNAQLLRVQGAEAEALKTDPEAQNAREKIDLAQMGAGLLIATTFFAWGCIVNKFVPSIHQYAWMIISVAVVKALGILPQKFEICCYQWFQFVMKNLTGVLLVGIGVAYTDLKQIASAFSPQYLLLVFVTVAGAILGSGFVGKLVGFYPIDAAITAGLCMANMGGTGDVAVLSASDRMELMPFAQISSRIGGAFILILASVLLKIIGG
ncbi:MAG: 2-hydroxycarboxylate transporter family protein [Treponemataceae bacterium]|nr:MAG: 2-hydroxycarboxylate transporter family protein [Treponemataceae bacterium]